jgi:hypothetical protein
MAAKVPDDGRCQRIRVCRRGGTTRVVVELRGRSSLIDNWIGNFCRAAQLSGRPIIMHSKYDPPICWNIPEVETCP